MQKPVNATLTRDQFIKLRNAKAMIKEEFGKDVSPHGKYPCLGSADLCFLTNLQMGQIVEHLVEKRIEIVDGPVHRTGANGPILSVYIKDPDGNLIEIANQLSTSTPDQNHAA